MSSGPDPRLAPLVEAALAGARAAMAVYGADFSVERKADDSPVSEADRAAERAILAHLSTAMPDIPVVAEEACAAGSAPHPGRAFLLVDPLDGTKEFISRNGEFTVNIALIEEGAPVLGRRPRPGAWPCLCRRRRQGLQGKLDARFEHVTDWTRIHSRPAASPAVAVASRSHLNPATEEALRLAGTGDCRSIGSSLKFCLLAEGEADFYPRLGPTMEWDIAAGDALLRAAGGIGHRARWGAASLRQDRHRRHAGLRESVLPRRRRPGAAEAAPARQAPAEPGGMSAAPLVLETAGVRDYALLDCGHGRKLERFGALVLNRPEEQAIWTPRLAAEDWERADAIFTGDIDEEGAGRWKRRAGLEEAWTCAHGAIRFSCRFTSFRHVGVFPEQEPHWSFMRERLDAATAPSLLNLFGYTGLASLIAAEAGAEVTHVDASKKAIAWARDNQALSGLDGKPIRWILDDALKFAAREVRRGRLYDGILLDPPKFGRGPKGETGTSSRTSLRC